MQSSFFLILLFTIIIFTTIPLADAHLAKIVGDFKIDIGWETEPPLAGLDNSIVITVSIAEESDKLEYEMIFFDLLDDSDDVTTEKDLLGLTNTLEAYVSTNGKKTFLTLEESAEDVGVYHANIIPTAGPYTVYLDGVIKNLEFDLSSKIENVEPNQDAIPTSHGLPAWIKNNAKWWAEGTIDDDSFKTGIQYMVKEKIIHIENLSVTSSTAESIPAWIKNNAKWWAEGTIDDDSFKTGIQYMVEKGIINIE